MSAEESFEFLMRSVYRATDLRLPSGTSYVAGDDPGRRPATRTDLVKKGMEITVTSCPRAARPLTRWYGFLTSPLTTGSSIERGNSYASIKIFIDELPYATKRWHAPESV